MIIKHITVKSFGSVDFYDIELNSCLNILDTHFADELNTIFELLLCRKSLQSFPAACACEGPFVSAEVLLGKKLYFVELKPYIGNARNPEINVKDSDGNDKTDFYLNTLSHCAEQDATDSFDGRDSSFSQRLCWYRDCDGCDAPNGLLGGTNYVIGTKTFRSHLIRYIKTFKPQSINNKKQYKAYITEQGRFEVALPSVSQEIHLSETEEKLFRYICFLNIAEFWENIENTRDMHHEKKPLIIKNFLEFLDQTTDINGLITRTAQLNRQAIILTLPMSKAVKNEWLCKTSSQNFETANHYNKKG